MENQRQIRVLSAFRPYLHILQAYKVENIRNNHDSPKIRQIGLSFVVAVAITATTFVAFLATWHIIETLNIREFSTSIAKILCFFQLVFTVVIIMSKTQLIIRTIDSIQLIVDERKLCETKIGSATFRSDVKIGNPHLHHIFLDYALCVECEESADSLIIYKRIEHIHTSLTKVLFRGSSMIVATSYGLTLLFPISHALFQYPAPREWRLALEIQ